MYQEIKKISKTNKPTIEQLYNLGSTSMGNTLAGHESVDCRYDILNIKQNDLSYSGNCIDFEKYYAPVKRVIRHRVKKDKWCLSDINGNSIVITGDHSLMVLRDGVLQKVKPCDVDEVSDLLVVVNDDDIQINEIDSCEKVGEFDDEYVYDIEVDDDTHTFVANDILVHNSIYASYDSIIEPTDWFDHDVWRLTKINKSNDQKDFTYVSTGGYPTEEDAKKYFDVDSIDTNKYEWSIDTIEPGGREFCLTMNRVFMSDFLKKIHDAYAKKNGTPNILDFELEAYNEAGIWLAKKKYIKNMTWAEPNVYYENCSKIKPTGVEIAQTSSSVWVKKKLTELIVWIFKQDKFSIDLFVKEMKKVKKEFMLQSPEIVSVNKGMNKYADYALDDTKEMEVAQKAMVTVQGAVLYNWILNNKPKFKKKYQTLVDSDKLCVLYIKPSNRYTYWKSVNILKDEYLKNPTLYRLDYAVEKMTNGKLLLENALIKAQCEAFSYPAGMYPIDMTDDIEIDYQRMFELLVLAPMNRILVAMGYAELSPELTFTSSLW